MNEIYSDSSYVFISKFVPKIPVPISPSIPKSRIPEANDPESRKSGFGTGISGLSGFPISRPSNTIIKLSKESTTNTIISSKPSRKII